VDRLLFVTPHLSQSMSKGRPLPLTLRAWTPDVLRLMVLLVPSSSTLAWRFSSRVIALPLRTSAQMPPLVRNLTSLFGMNWLLQDQYSIAAKRQVTPASQGITCFPDSDHPSWTPTSNSVFGQIVNYFADNEDDIFFFQPQHCVQTSCFKDADGHSGSATVCSNSTQPITVLGHELFNFASHIKAFCNPKALSQGVGGQIFDHSGLELIIKDGCSSDLIHIRSSVAKVLSSDDIIGQDASSGLYFLSPAFVLRH
jgi:hypothetical protein